MNESVFSLAGPKLNCSGSEAGARQNSSFPDTKKGEEYELYNCCLCQMRVLEAYPRIVSCTL